MAQNFLKCSQEKMGKPRSPVDDKFMRQFFKILGRYPSIFSANEKQLTQCFSFCFVFVAVLVVMVLNCRCLVTLSIGMALNGFIGPLFVFVHCVVSSQSTAYGVGWISPSCHFLVGG